MTAYCGYITRREPLGCFHGTEPNTGKKPISNPMVSKNLPELDGTNPRFILDVQITSPIPGVQSGSRP
jgi:hypothetical protein